MTHAGYLIGDGEGSMWAKAYCNADQFLGEDRIAINGFFRNVDCEKCLALLAGMEAIDG